MPSQIANDLEVHRREALRDEIKRKMQRAVEAFESPWLVRSEKELQECTVKLNGSKIDHENRASEIYLLFVVKRVKALRFDDLAITLGVNVFANSVEDQLAHLVAQFAVLASVFGDQNKVALELK